MASWSSPPALALAGMFVLQILLRHSAARTTFIVKVTPEELEKVADNLDQQGYVIRQKNSRYNYLVVEDPATTRAVRAAEVQAAAATRQAVEQDDSSTAANSAEARQRLESRSMTDSSPASKTSAAALKAINTARARLSGEAGVSAVQHNPRVQLFGRSNISRYHLQAATGVRRGRHLHTATSCPDDAFDKYAAVFDYPDLVIGRSSEQAPYSISMVQANFSTLVDVSSTYRDKVLFCVIDDGMDASNPEFKAASTSGCTPGHIRPITGTVHNCSFAWNEPGGSHGTHTSGIIAAQRTGTDHGIVGVSGGGAHLYHVNVFGSNDYGDGSDIMDAWLDCISELDYQRASTNTPDMRMVISMSLGWQGAPASGGDVIHDLLADLSAARSDDILWVAAAGNDQSADVNYPAGYPEVISVAAVDDNSKHAYFSDWNSDVEWSGPGVDILSTVPLGEAACRSSYNMNIRVVTGMSSLLNDMLTQPWPYLIDGSGNSSASLKPVTAPLIDCGLGTSTCSNAAKKICLIQLDWPTYYCEQVYNCMQGGGVGVLIYHSSQRSIVNSTTNVDVCANQSPLPADCTMSDCTPIAFVSDESLLYPDLSNYAKHCPNKPAQGFQWPVAMGISLGQGKAIRSALQSNAGMQITLDPCNSTAGGTAVGLDFMSGTSMATPAAAGVAGLVWSAHSSCVASEIRAAVSASALDVNTTGRDNYTGYGIVQAAAAHQYLLTHPCKAVGSSNQLGTAETWATAYQGSVDSYLRSYFSVNTAQELNNIMTKCKQEPVLTGTLQRTSPSGNMAPTCQDGCYSMYSVKLYRGSTCNISLLTPTWSVGGCLSGVGVVAWKDDGTWSSITGVLPANGTGTGAIFTLQYTAGNQASAAISSVDSATPCTTQYTLSAGLTTSVKNGASLTASMHILTWCLLLATSIIVGL